MNSSEELIEGIDEAIGKKIDEDFDVEASLKRLDEINNALSQEGVSLKESMALYAEGVELAAKCNDHLKGVEKEIKVINDATKED